jgi:radical SAM/Cys-rich protein
MTAGEDFLSMTASKFHDKILSLRPEPLLALDLKILQVNLGYQCNLACKHCHVSAGPGRSEVMDGRTIDAVLRAFLDNPFETLDITGGSPELNPHFRALVAEARKAGRHVIVRTNLAIFFERGMDDLPRFYRDNGVELVASLPYYIEDGVDRVRGSGTFKKSIAALKLLNGLGYGNGARGTSLSLVYNPQGMFLAPAQGTLEAEYRRELGERFGVSFTRLYTFTNMPVGRFREFLVRTGNLEKYTSTLSCAFNPLALDGIMCRHLLNVGWDGRLFDCDFNQVLGLGVDPDKSQHIRDFDHDALAHRRITVDDHCFGCTAGQGST